MSDPRCPECNQPFGPKGLAIHIGIKHRPRRLTLDAAWAEAEAALPPDHVLAELRRFDEGWSASTDNITNVGRYHWSAEGLTRRRPPRPYRPPHRHRTGDDRMSERTPLTPNRWESLREMTPEDEAHRHFESDDDPLDEGLICEGCKEDWPCDFERGRRSVALAASEPSDRLDEAAIESLTSADQQRGAAKLRDALAAALPTGAKP